MATLILYSCNNIEILPSLTPVLVNIMFMCKICGTNGQKVVANVTFICLQQTIISEIDCSIRVYRFLVLVPIL